VGFKIHKRASPPELLFCVCILLHYVWVLITEEIPDMFYTLAPFLLWSSKISFISTENWVIKCAVKLLALILTIGSLTSVTTDLSSQNHVKCVDSNSSFSTSHICSCDPFHASRKKLLIFHLYFPKL
jgi:hypothetical protein